MSGRHPSRPRPPWETQEQPLYTPDDMWYGRARGPRVVIKPHARPAGGGRQGRYTEPQRESRRGRTRVRVAVGLAAAVGIGAAGAQLTHVGWGRPPAPATQAAATVTTPAPTPTPTPI